jgi:hypothetical protein
MVSNLQNPYKVIEENPLDYSFVNRDGINYHLYFTPISSIYPDLLNTFSFSIEREGTRPHPIDLRIAATVVYILRRFFETVENAMIMVCDSTDGKQHKRRNLFDRWFQLYNDGTLATVNAEVGQGEYELLLSIYFRKDNPNKQQLIKAFGDLLAKDCFEIVI